MELVAGGLNCPDSGINLNPQWNLAEILWLINSKGFVFVAFLGHCGSLRPLYFSSYVSGFLQHWGCAWHPCSEVVSMRSIWAISQCLGSPGSQWNGVSIFPWTPGNDWSFCCWRVISLLVKVVSYFCSRQKRLRPPWPLGKVWDPPVLKERSEAPFIHTSIWNSSGSVLLGL